MLRIFFICLISIFSERLQAQFDDTLHFTFDYVAYEYKKRFDPKITIPSDLKILLGYSSKTSLILLKPKRDSDILSIPCFIKKITEETILLRCYDRSSIIVKLDPDFKKIVIDVVWINVKSKETLHFIKKKHQS